MRIFNNERFWINKEKLIKPSGRVGNVFYVGRIGEVSAFVRCLSLDSAYESAGEHEKAEKEFQKNIKKSRGN